MTIEEVPTHILRESLLAIADLGRKYRGEEMVTAYADFEDYPEVAQGQWNCPLCNLASIRGVKDSKPRYKSSHGNRCDCPWFWFEGHRCCGDGFYSEFHSQPIPARISRIARWTEAINAELAGRPE